MTQIGRSGVPAFYPIQSNLSSFGRINTYTDTNVFPNGAVLYRVGVQ